MDAYAAGGASKAAVQSQIYGGTSLQNDGSFAASSVGRITANYVNGPATTVNGVDLYIKFEDDYANGVIAAGLEANYVAKYSVDAYMKGAVQVAANYECAGFFNINNPCRPCLLYTSDAADD